jgi:DNA-binding XRE family transcriptional regulator
VPSHGGGGSQPAGLRAEAFLGTPNHGPRRADLGLSGPGRRREPSTQAHAELRLISYNTCDITLDVLEFRPPRIPIEDIPMLEVIGPIPPDYSARVRAVRDHLQVTQTQLAKQIGVSFATVNRWENGQSRPTRLAWQQILDLENGNPGTKETSSVSSLFHPHGTSKRRYRPKYALCDAATPALRPASSTVSRQQARSAPHS